jgi:hypothetical protein
MEAMVVVAPPQAKTAVMSTVAAVVVIAVVAQSEAMTAVMATVAAVVA